MTLRPRAGNDGGEQPGRTLMSGQAHSKVQGLFHSPFERAGGHPSPGVSDPPSRGEPHVVGSPPALGKRGLPSGLLPVGEVAAKWRMRVFCHRNETARATFRTALVVTEVESFATLVEGGIHPALRKRESEDLGCDLCR